jgi:hypothetical protein
MTAYIILATVYAAYLYWYRYTGDNIVWPHIVGRRTILYDITVRETLTGFSLLYHIYNSHVQCPAMYVCVIF